MLGILRNFDRSFFVDRFSQLNLTNYHKLVIIFFTFISKSFPKDVVADPTFFVGFSCWIHLFEVSRPAKETVPVLQSTFEKTWLQGL